MFTVHELLYLTKALLTHTLGSRDAIASKHIVKVTDWLHILRMILQRGSKRSYRQEHPI